MSKLIKTGSYISCILIVVALSSTSLSAETPYCNLQCGDIIWGSDCENHWLYSPQECVDAVWFAYEACLEDCVTHYV